MVTLEALFQALLTEPITLQCFAMNVLLWLTLLIATCFYWFDTTKAKENAITHARKACRDMNLQFLDDSVVRTHSAIRRGVSGHAVIERTFGFEFTIDGYSRKTGYLQLSGHRLKTLELDYPEEQSPNRLYLHTSEEPHALRQRAKKRPDCCH